MPVCTRYNMWTCSRWHDRWSPEASWLGHQSTPRQSVVHRSDSGCIDTWCPRGAWLDSVRGNVPASRINGFLIQEVLTQLSCTTRAHCPSIWSVILWEWVWGPACSDQRWHLRGPAWGRVLLGDRSWSPLRALGTALCSNTPTIKGMSRNYI